LIGHTKIAQCFQCAFRLDAMEFSVWPAARSKGKLGSLLPSQRVHPPSRLARKSAATRQVACGSLRWASLRGLGFKHAVQGHRSAPRTKMDVYNLIILLILLAFIVWTYGRGRWF
jgi:hypothetical protein